MIICTRATNGQVLYLRRGGSWTTDRAQAARFAPDDYFETGSLMCWMEDA